MNTAMTNIITESNYANNCGSWATVTVKAPITASCTVSPTSAQTNASVTWTATASGGVGALTYTWGGNVSGTGSSVTQSYASAGTENGTVTVTDTNGDTSGAVSCSKSLTVYGCVPALSASPTTIALGDTSTLTWSENTLCASSCLFSDGHSAGLSGTYRVTPPDPSPGTTDTYSLTCGVSANTNQTTITVNVPKASISAAPDRVAVNGTTALTWSSSQVSACTITRNGVSMGSTFNQTSGTSINDPTPITTQTKYVITCTGIPDGTATAQAVVNVVPAFTEF
jgi:hypothetical protein